MKKYLVWHSSLCPVLRALGKNKFRRSVGATRRRGSSFQSRNRRKARVIVLVTERRTKLTKHLCVDRAASDPSLVRGERVLSASHGLFIPGAFWFTSALYDMNFFAPNPTNRIRLVDRVCFSTKSLRFPRFTVWFNFQWLYASVMY